MTDVRWPLEPTQAGMLFQALRAPAGGYDIEQLVVRLDEPVDDQAFREAWRIVAARHDALRSAFRWHGVDVPEQVVSGEVTLEIEHHDLGRDDSGDGEARLEQLLAADRRRGFDLQRPPWRVLLCHLGARRSAVVWSFHHLILDGRSFARLLTEVFAAHEAVRRGRSPDATNASPTLPEAARALAAVPLREDDAQHWRALLQGKGAPTPLPFAEPASNPLPVEGSGASTIQLDERTTAALHALAHDCDVTMSTVVHALWALWLSRWSGDTDVLFGSTRSTRRAATGVDARDVVGMFIQTLPLRLDLSDHRTVRELLADVRQQQLALRGRERSSLVDVAGQSDIPRSIPLFDTLVMYDPEELNHALRRGDPAWAARTVTVHEQPAAALVLTAFDGARVTLRLLYEKRRIRDSTAARIVRHLEALAIRLGGGAGQRLGPIESIPDEERRTILFDWNATERVFPDSHKIHHGFEQRALSQPDAVALVQSEQAWSYREVEERANRLAHLLRVHGAAPGTWVGVCMERTPALVVALLGIAKSGAAYVPIDPDYPRDRIEFMVKDCGAGLVVTERAVRASLGDVPCLVVDGEDADALAAMPSTRPSAVGSATDACYAIFTSGSTGTPKGVVLSHRAVVNTFDWVSRTFGVGPQDRLLFVTSPCFDLSVYDTFGALAAGATVEVASSAELKDPQALVEKIVRGGITIWDSAPQALQRLAPLLPERAPESRLRLVMLSGDWIPIGLPPHLQRVFDGVEVKSLGGATEAAIWSNWYPIGALDPRWSSVPYGRPIQNARYHVLDASMRPTPPGVPGDLYIGGVCLADGYLNRAQLTAERFIPDPFQQHEPSGARARLYRTGDLARYFDDGNLEFLGRADFQVKVRGFRVELGEVEGVLSQQRGVREVVCAARRDASGEQNLWAYVTLTHDAPFDADAAPPALRSALAARLPEFMVPSGVIVLEKMPLSGNGKLDRAALPAPTVTGRSRSSRAASTALERQLVDLWAELLGRGPIGVDDNFFELGGHSLLAVTLMTRLKSRLGIEAPLSQILEYPTVATLAAALAPANHGAARVPSSLILLREGGPDNLFLIFDGDGETLLYRTLALKLPTRFAVFGVPPRRLPRTPIADTTIPAMAESALRAVRERQAHGPYFLGGLCAGGVIAYETAARLSRSGEAVGLVAILDAANPAVPQKRFLRTSRRWERLKDAVDVGQRGGISKLKGLARSALAVARKVNALAEYETKSRAHAASARARYHLLSALTKRGVEWPEQLPAPTVREVYVEAKARYRPAALGATPVIVAKATSGVGADEPASALVDDARLGWGDVVDRDKLEVVVIPGGHSSMLQAPHVDFLAQQLSERLR